MVQVLDRVSSRYLIRVLGRSFHWHSIKHNRRHKLKRGLIPRKGQASLVGCGPGAAGYASPEKFIIVRCQRCDFMYLGGDKVLRKMSCL